MQSAVYTIHVVATQPLQMVTIDPANRLPDSNRENNVWKNK
jgi:hypothetical protein